MPDDRASHKPARPGRPAYLMPALLVVWMLGVGGVMGGCQTLQFYRQTTHPSLDLDAHISPELRAHVEAQQTARIEALSAHQSRMIPLAAANVLLSGLLIVACARALSGRPSAHNLALQAIGANIAYAVVDYVVSAPVRYAVIHAGAQHPPATMPPIPEAQVAAMYAWFFRLALFGQLAVLAITAFALTRPRVLAWYRADEP